jgi:hypothetical protein
MDTRFWGPSGWQLFHLIAFYSPNPKDVLTDMKDVLPCKFCRASTAEFTAKHPIRKPYGKWLYEIHNMVNNKLRSQCSEDPAVINPGPDPSFEEVKARYDAMKPNEVPGRDFLMAVAYNYPANPEPKDIETQERFIRHLREAFPFDELRPIVQSHPEPDLKNQKTYTKWMYGLLAKLSAKVGSKIRSYRGYMSHLSFYKSGCARKTYKGKTCRRLPNGKLTKARDNVLTRRIVGGSLL